VLGLTSPSSGNLVDASSPTPQSPTTSPPPTSTGKTNTNNNGNSNQNGRHVQALPYTQQNGRNYLFSQHFLLHPAFRGLTARTQLPGVTSGKLSVASGQLVGLRDIKNVNTVPLPSHTNCSVLSLQRADTACYCVFIKL
jgi:hypothetical protein